MAEGTEEGQEPVVVPPTEPIVPRETPPAEIPPATEPDEEPGGKSPLEVARRKEYELRKAAEARADEEHDKAIRLEEQLRAAQAKPVAPEKQFFTEAQVQAAIDSGEITVLQGAGLLDRQERVREREAERQRAVAQRPIERALQDIEEYKTYVPTLNDQSSEDFKKVATEYRRLVQERGLAPGHLTEAVAAENTLGRLSEIKARRQMDAATRASGNPAPSDAGAGGGAGGGNGAGILSKATPTQIASWNRDGLSQKQRIEEMQIYNQLKSSGRFR